MENEDSHSLKVILSAPCGQCGTVHEHTQTSIVPTCHICSPWRPAACLQGVSQGESHPLHRIFKSQGELNGCPQKQAAFQGTCTYLGGQSLPKAPCPSQRQENILIAPHPPYSLLSPHIVSSFLVMVLIKALLCSNSSIEKSSQLPNSINLLSGMQVFNLIFLPH